ncbi:hypothetical protein [Ralstonia pseudosolanacearum]|uniref:hypothetical protein n=1 Tax=Ralstonia pseudosolanacearum TaxID=1310165 RepID=UPI003CE97963
MQNIAKVDHSVLTGTGVPGEAGRASGSSLTLFKRLPLGARFRYQGSDREWVVLDVSGCGRIAEVADGQLDFVAQSVCSAAETEEATTALEVIPVRVKTVLTSLPEGVLAALRQAAANQSEVAESASGGLMFISYGDGEQKMIDAAAVACPHCGGSGHKDDVTPISISAVGLTPDQLGAVEEAIAIVRGQELKDYDRVVASLQSILSHALAAQRKASFVESYIDLQGLAKQLLAPREIVREGEGWLRHPGFPVCDENVRADKFLAAFGIESFFRQMDGDVSDERYERFLDEGDCADWNPTPPEGEGWMLLEIYDTEDGPYALFAREEQTK